MDTHVVLQAAMHLSMEDLARWRAVDTATKNTLEIDGEENVWRQCALSYFTCNRLFASYSLYESSQRTLCFKFHSLLQRANYMLSSNPLLVEDIGEATLIERRLREAFRACSAHRDASGRDSQVLLGSVCLRGETETMFQFGGEEMAPTIAGLPPGVLVLKMALHKDRVKTWAAYGVLRGNTLELCQQAASMQLTFNMSSADCDVSVGFRGIPLILDARWRSWNCSTSHCKCSQTYESWPVLFAITLLEATQAETRPRLADALSRQPR
eukprot:TRINITY_DN10238_c1_g3_i1.p1 TRINITY_DN10238_c1_g3~~TRINITY_DN10238_c1_g3_i1.p1  ORF type:complete len:268 (-),score=29.13 TRINITY_DN10238_c1_g3_i1:210-1013(-)